jgi:hypothetical protein
MPDEITTNDGSTRKITFTLAEIEFLYNLLDNVQVKGVETIVAMNDLSLKLAEHYVPPTDKED